MYSKIVVGTDGSGTAATAVAHAAELAQAGGADLIVVSAYSAPREAPTTFVSPDVAPGIEVATGLLEDVAKRYGDEVSLTTLAREGHPADVIIDTAAEHEAGVIVVGNKGMSGARRFVLGSVPNTITHHAPCDVLIVHTTDE
jgi:nucleotide-binding universal stress UspA family protein